MTNITDGSPKYKKSFAHSVIAPIGTLAELALPNGTFNGTQEDVKRYGSVVIGEKDGASGYILLMATGSAYNAKWTGLGVADDVAVTADSTVALKGTDSKPVMKKRKLGSLDFPVVAEADIKDGNHAINDFLLGGKKFGSAVIVAKPDGRYVLALAANGNHQDKWHGVDGAVLYTPSAPTVTTAPFDKKPVMKQSRLSAVPFAVIDSVSLAKKDHPINSGDGIASGKRKGSLVVVRDVGSNTPSLRLSTTDTDVGPWVLPLGSNATTPVVPS